VKEPLEWGGRLSGRTSVLGGICPQAPVVWKSFVRGRMSGHQIKSNQIKSNLLNYKGLDNLLQVANGQNGLWQ